MKITKKYLQKLMKEETNKVLSERSVDPAELEQTDLGAPVSNLDTAMEALEQIAALRSDPAVGDIRREYATRALAKIGYNSRDIKSIRPKIPYWHEEGAPMGGDGYGPGPTVGAVVPESKNYLQKVISEEANKILAEGSAEMLGWMAKTAANINRTTIDEAEDMLKVALRAFYDDNDRRGVVSAIREAEEVEEQGEYPLAVQAAQIRHNIEELLHVLWRRRAAMKAAEPEVEQ